MNSVGTSRGVAVDPQESHCNVAHLLGVPKLGGVTAGDDVQFPVAKEAYCVPRNRGRAEWVVAAPDHLHGMVDLGQLLSGEGDLGPHPAEAHHSA
jgi:hypothetical protein